MYFRITLCEKLWSSGFSLGRRPARRSEDIWTDLQPYNDLEAFVFLEKGTPPI
jgi:hypothetical protein